MDLISVIVPVYNVEKYLKRCVDSIRNQSYKNLELILVDDGSPDSSGEICEKFKKEDERIKVIHKDNEGLGYARNSGLELVTGKYVTFIDSDDWIGENHILNLYNSIKENDSDLAIGGYTSVNLLEEKAESLPNLARGLYTGENIITDILLPLIGSDLHSKNDIQLQSSCCMNLYKVQIIKENRLQFPSERHAVAEDLFFNVDFLFFANKVMISDEAGYFYFQNMESISRRYNPMRHKRTNQFYIEMNKKIENYNLKEMTDLRLKRTYLMKIRVALRLIVESDMLYKDKFREIKNILQDNLLNVIINSYPIGNYIPVMRTLMFFVKKQNVGMLYFLIKLREILNENKLFRFMLRLVGIKR